MEGSVIVLKAMGQSSCDDGDSAVTWFTHDPPVPQNDSPKLRCIRAAVVLVWLQENQGLEERGEEEWGECHCPALDLWFIFDERSESTEGEVERPVQADMHEDRAKGESGVIMS